MFWRLQLERTSTMFLLQIQLLRRKGPNDEHLWKLKSGGACIKRRAAAAGCSRFGSHPLEERHMLRSRLQCHDFQWFLDTVMKSGQELLSYFEINGAGHIRNQEYQHRCLDDADDASSRSSNKIHLKACHGHGHGQYWMLTTSG